MAVILSRSFINELSCLLVRNSSGNNALLIHNKPLHESTLPYDDIDALVQDCSISSVLAMEILQSCPEPSIYKW